MNKYTEKEIELLDGLLSELVNINDELNAKCIAFDAKLKNEEAKVKALQIMLYQCKQNKEYLNIN
jgi:hypothetical protein